MSAKATPGPWVIVGEKDLPQHDDLMIVACGVAAPGEDPDDSIYVCNVGSDGGAYGKCAPVAAGARWPVSLATAKLISAAPDLADALEALLRCIAGTTPARDAVSFNATSDAHAALRKAGRIT